MKEQFRDKKFSQQNLALLGKATMDAIIEKEKDDMTQLTEFANKLQLEGERKK